MQYTLNSKAAKAQIATDIEKSDTAQKLQAESPLKTKRDIRGFWAQYPKTRDLFGAIMTKWRASSARRPGREGYWAAYPYPEWTALTGLPDRTLKRHLDRLEQHGLIERTHGRHSGTRQLTFIRPTALAFTLSDAKRADWTRLGIDPDKPTSYKPVPDPLPVLPFQEDEDTPITSLEQIWAIVGKPK